MTFPEYMKTDHAEEIEERAAIMEYQGGMTRERAEYLAARWIDKKYGQGFPRPQVQNEGWAPSPKNQGRNV